VFRHNSTASGTPGTSSCVSPLAAIERGIPLVSRNIGQALPAAIRPGRPERTVPDTRLGHSQSMHPRRKPRIHIDRGRLIDDGTSHPSGKPRLVPGAAQSPTDWRQQRQHEVRHNEKNGPHRKHLTYETDLMIRDEDTAIADWMQTEVELEVLPGPEPGGCALPIAPAGPVQYSYARSHGPNIVLAECGRRSEAVRGR
jgi:hypothetical protein